MERSGWEHYTVLGTAEIKPPSLGLKYGLTAHPSLCKPSSHAEGVRTQALVAFPEGGRICHLMRMGHEEDR